MLSRDLRVCCGGRLSEHYAPSGRAAREGCVDFNAAYRAPVGRQSSDLVHHAVHAFDQRVVRRIEDQHAVRSVVVLACIPLPAATHGCRTAPIVADSGTECLRCKPGTGSPEFSIIVDFLSKHLKSRRAGRAAPDAVRTTFCSVGRALWTTTAVLSCGFLAFTRSGFETSWALGLLVTVTLLFALIKGLLLLSPLLMAVDRSRS